MTATLTTLVSFNGADGENPEAGLIADAGGDLFGTAGNSVFEIAKTSTGYASTATVLASFNGFDGDGPEGSLLADAEGDLFGATSGGGPGGLYVGKGTVFEIAKTPTGYAGTPTTLVSFAEDNAPQGLITDANGDLFGTTELGGPDGGGTVFEIVKTATDYASTPITLASFNLADERPAGGVIMDASGDLFGVTDGTLLNEGRVFEIKKTASGYASTPTTLVSFNSLEDPRGGLIADSAGNLFGTTENGGANDDGTVFEITGSGFVSGGRRSPRRRASAS